MYEYDDSPYAIANANGTLVDTDYGLAILMDALVSVGCKNVTLCDCDCECDSDSVTVTL